MKCSVIGVMKTHMDKYNVPVCNENMGLLLEDLCRFSGAEAGICYMKESYFDSYVTDQTKALSRFNQIIGTGHHSVSGHAQVAVLFEGISKILAMYLNNLTDYETSEKSGRYTTMQSNSEKEKELYEKWQKILVSNISIVYNGKVPENTIDKLAKENARNFLSVFTHSTTMGYTTSLRQWNYIIDWAEKFIKSDLDCNPFINNLKGEFIDLVNVLKPLFYVEGLRDVKNRIGFDLIDFDLENKEVAEEKDIFDSQYSVSYKSSFVALAQAQRHRTLHYKAFFDGVAKEFYVPDILKGGPLEKEWLKDMRELAKDIVPQGTLILVNEKGRLDDFYLKTMERNCGRAQLEIMQQTLNTSQKFIDNLSDFSFVDQFLIKQFTKKGYPKMKCELVSCKEPCAWGAIDAKTRLI